MYKVAILKGSSLNMLKSKPITFRIFDFIGQETAIHYSRIYSRLENANCSLLGCLLLLFQPLLEKTSFISVLINCQGRFTNFLGKLK